MLKVKMPNDLNAWLKVSILRVLRVENSFISFHNRGMGKVRKSIMHWGNGLFC
jgi:hypothetical protein